VDTPRFFDVSVFVLVAVKKTLGSVAAAQ